MWRRCNLHGRARGAAAIAVAAGVALTFATAASTGGPSEGLRASVETTNHGPLAVGDVVWHFIYVENKNDLTNENGGTANNGNTIAFQIAGGQSKKFTTTGDGNYAGGFASVTSNQPVSGSAVFSEFDAGGTRLPVGPQRSNKARRSSLRGPAASRSRCARSHVRNPGTGDNVAKRRMRGSSSRSSTATCLMRKLPNEIPRSPSWQLVIE